MHFQSSGFLLLTTAALTSVAVATRPDSATSNLLSSAIANDIWADEIKFAEDRGHVHHASFRIDANHNIAKRDVVVSATATEYDTKTLTTDITASSTLKTQEKEKVPDSKGKAKAKNDSQTAVLYSAASTTKAGYSKERNNSDVANTKPTSPAAHREPNTNTVPTPSLRNSAASQSSQSSLSTTPAVKTTPTTPLIGTTPTTTPVTTPNINTHHLKRSPGGFEYVYDSTTLTSVANTNVGNYASSRVVPAHTQKLRFGQQSLAATPSKKQ